MAGGSALWGAVALHAGLNAAYFGIAAGLLLSGGLAIRLRPAADEVVDFTPAHHWPEPAVAGEPSPEAGPVMVQVEYRVDRSRREAFRNAMAELARNRRRDGAVQWWLFQDTADPSRFVETWIEATWVEHLRNHERVSVAQQELEERIRALTQRGSTTSTRHFIAPEPRPMSSALVRQVEERIRRSVP
jgi:quinol monooxygenase YgiN